MQYSFSFMDEKIEFEEEKTTSILPYVQKLINLRFCKKLKYYTLKNSFVRRPNNQLFVFGTEKKQEKTLLKDRIHRSSLEKVSTMELSTIEMFDIPVVKFAVTLSKCPVSNSRVDQKRKSSL